MSVFAFNVGFDTSQATKKERKKDKRLKEKMEPKTMSHLKFNQR